MGYWNYSGVQIHDGGIDGALPAAFAMKDLSAVVGVQRAVVFLSFRQNDLVVSSVCIKPNGEALDTDNVYSGDHGICNAYSRVGHTHSMMTATDTLGRIQWEESSGAGADFDVWIDGWWVPSVAPVQIDPGFVVSVNPTWADVDCSAHVGAKRSLEIMRHRRTAGVGNYAFSARPKRTSGAKDFVANQFSCLGAQHGVSAAGVNIEVVCAITDDTGTYQLAVDTSSTAQTHELYSYAGENISFLWKDEELFPVGVPVRNTWTELDTGAGRSGLAFIRCDFAFTDVLNQFMFFRRKGDTRDWANVLSGSITAGGCSKGFGWDATSDLLVVPMDDDGLIEYYAYAGSITASTWGMTLLGYVTSDPGSPTISEIYPEKIKTGTLDRIGFQIDDEIGMDLTSIDLTAVSPRNVRVPIIASGVFQSGWDGLILASDSDKHVEVAVTEFSDDLENGMRWTFEIEGSNVGGSTI